MCGLVDRTRTLLGVRLPATVSCDDPSRTSPSLSESAPCATCTTPCRSLNATLADRAARRIDDAVEPRCGGGTRDTEIACDESCERRLRWNVRIEQTTEIADANDREESERRVAERRSRPDPADAAALARAVACDRDASGLRVVKTGRVVHVHIARATGVDRYCPLAGQRGDPVRARIRRRTTDARKRDRRNRSCSGMPSECKRAHVDVARPYRKRIGRTACARRQHARGRDVAAGRHAAVSRVDLRGLAAAAGNRRAERAHGNAAERGVSTRRITAHRPPPAAEHRGKASVRAAARFGGRRYAGQCRELDAAGALKRR